MFDKPYRLKGIHSKKARELVAIFDGVSKAQFFKAAKDVYAFAPLVGFLYNRRAELDHTKSEETGEEERIGQELRSIVSGFNDDSKNRQVA